MFFKLTPSRSMNITNKLLFVTKHYIINALSAVQWVTMGYICRLNTMITHTYVYSDIQHTYKHRIASNFDADKGWFFHAYTHSYLCGSCERIILPFSSQQLSFVVPEKSTCSATLDSC